jgi:hypothetical protein
LKEKKGCAYLGVPGDISASSKTEDSDGVQNTFTPCSKFLSDPVIHSINKESDTEYWRGFHRVSDER